MKGRVAYLVERGRFELRDEEVRPLGEREILVRVGACGICTGDIYAFLGYPVWYRLPAALGHEPAGVVVDVGPRATRFKPGDRVAVLGGPGYADYVIVDESYAEPVPPGVPIEHALGEPLACAVNGVRLAEPKFGDTVAVVGTGFMGLLLVQALSRMGLDRLAAVDVKEERLELAAEFGADTLLNPERESPEKLAAEVGGGFDIVIEATGSPKGVEVATKLARRRGRLCIFSFHPLPVPVDLAAWDSKGLEVIMTNPNRAEDMRPNLRLAMRMLGRGVFKMEKLVTHKWPLSEIQAAFEYASKKPRDYIKGVIVP
ncbi:MAG: zinc-binding dehydrogenase [Thermofilum sp.]|nr:zinc-binding dehydrogenase [Thermofilum sp.]